MGKNAYDEGKYGMIQRTWFGRPLTKGGDAAAAIAISGSATTKNVVTGYYPKGPIVIEKFGVQVVATLASAANATGSVKRQRVPFELYKGASGARTTLLGTCHVVCGDGGRTALYGIASQAGSSLSSQEVEAGSGLTIYMATANSDNGTAMSAIGTVVRAGSLAYFIDFRPKFSSKWDTTSG